VRGGYELAIRPGPQHVPDVDHERVRQRWHVDPLAGPVSGAATRADAGVPSGVRLDAVPNTRNRRIWYVSFEWKPLDAIGMDSIDERSRSRTCKKDRG